MGLKILWWVLTVPLLGLAMNIAANLLTPWVQESGGILRDFWASVWAQLFVFAVLLAIWAVVYWQLRKNPSVQDKGIVTVVSPLELTKWLPRIKDGETSHRYMTERVSRIVERLQDAGTLGVDVNGLADIKADIKNNRWVSVLDKLRELRSDLGLPTKEAIYIAETDPFIPVDRIMDEEVQKIRDKSITAPLEAKIKELEDTVKREREQHAAELTEERKLAAAELAENRAVLTGN